jgi:ubiquinone/menaquinone biosynthesis C-methylase UbiE
VGELEQLPFGDDSFDVTTGFNSFQYATDPVHALAEAKRVTKPNSYVLVAAWGAAEKCQLASYIAAFGELLPPPRRVQADRSRYPHQARLKRW